MTNFATKVRSENVPIVQGDIAQFPFPYHYAEHHFCFGVLQHTPDPKAIFLVASSLSKTGRQSKSLAR